MELNLIGCLSTIDIPEQTKSLRLKTIFKIALKKLNNEDQNLVE